MSESRSESGHTARDGLAAQAGRGAPDAYDVVIVGASLAGCSSAIALGRAGLKVALIEKRPDPQAYKKICSHYIQSSAIAPLQRLGLLEPMMQAGAVRSRVRIHTPWGWIGSPPGSRVPSGVNLRRERLDPLIRDAAAETPGVDLMLGEAVDELLYDGEAVAGVKTRDTHGSAKALKARLVVGADGRGSQVAKLAKAPAKTVKHGRFAYGAYFEGPAPDGAPDASFWLLDPDMAAVFPTDSDLCFYAVMPTMARLEDFKADPGRALVDFISSVPEAPPIAACEPVAPVQGKIDMTNVAHRPVAPGLALVGDAALAIDPLWGIGCGWAFQSSEWLTDSVIPALQGGESLKKGLARYRRLHRRRLGGHAAMIYDYAGGRKFTKLEKGLFATTTEDDRLAEVFEAFGTRNIGPARMFAQTVPRVAYLSAKRSLTGRRASSRGHRQPAGAAQAGAATQAGGEASSV